MWGFLSNVTQAVKATVRPEGYTTPSRPTRSHDQDDDSTMTVPFEVPTSGASHYQDPTSAQSVVENARPITPPHHTTTMATPTRPPSATTTHPAAATEEEVTPSRTSWWRTGWEQAVTSLHQVLEHPLGEEEEEEDSAGTGPSALFPDPQQAARMALFTSPDRRMKEESPRELLVSLLQALERIDDLGTSLLDELRAVKRWTVEDHLHNLDALEGLYQRWERDINLPLIEAHEILSSPACQDLKNNNSNNPDEEQEQALLVTQAQKLLVLVRDATLAPMMEFLAYLQHLQQSRFDLIAKDSAKSALQRVLQADQAFLHAQRHAPPLQSSTLSASAPVPPNENVAEQLQRALVEAELHTRSEITREQLADHEGLIEVRQWLQQQSYAFREWHDDLLIEELENRVALHNNEEALFHNLLKSHFKTATLSRGAHTINSALQTTQPLDFHAAPAKSERLRLEAEEAERLRLEAEEAERLRLEAEEAERLRLEAEEAERLRLEAEEAERLRLEAEEAERLRLEAEEAERLRLEAEEAERLRLEAEEAERMVVVMCEAEQRNGLCGMEATELRSSLKEIVALGRAIEARSLHTSRVNELIATEVSERRNLERNYSEWCGETTAEMTMSRPTPSKGRNLLDTPSNSTTPLKRSAGLGLGAPLTTTPLRSSAVKPLLRTGSALGSGSVGGDSAKKMASPKPSNDAGWDDDWATWD